MFFSLNYGYDIIKLYEYTKGKFKMTKRFEKERAEAENILSNYKKNLVKYFDNPASYNKLVSALMPAMQEQIKLINDFRDSSIEIGVEQDITLGGLTGPKLIFGMKSFDPHYTTAYAKVATSGIYKLSDYKFKNYDDYKEYSNTLDEVIDKFPELSVGANARTTEISIYYKKTDELIAEHVTPMIFSIFENFATANNVRVRIRQKSANRFTFRFV